MKREAEVKEMSVREYRLASAEELDLAKTFECGQCFRWNADADGVYTGAAYGHAAALWTRDGEVIIRTDAPLEFWREYFDLERDYDEISRSFIGKGGEYLDNCVEYGRGIRILRQEPWEALCSFIISQCNNIKRIKGIVERLCSEFGEEFEFDGRRYFSFPDAQKLALLDEADLAPLRCGYRAAYIITAARAVAFGELDLQALIACPYAEAKKALLALNGVGEKVANCVVLFGLFHMEAFPIDVWIRRALHENFPADFDPAALGEYAGLAQQYIFYFARESGK